jgi:hypothetical protein
MKKAALLALALSSAVTAADKAAPVTEAKKSVAGFSGLLIVTSDKDWEKKWNASPERIPYLSSGSTVKRGGELFIITMFGNPQLDGSGAASVSMDIDVIRPDGASSSHAEDAVCARGKVAGPVESFYLCGQVVGFTAEASDPVGTWSVRIVLKDDIRKVSIPLATQFVLADEPTAR